MEEKYFNDKIYGSQIPFPTKWFKAVVEHKLFERLTKIRQLGAMTNIKGIENHTRFSHSIGTAYLASEKMKDLVLTDSIKQKVIFASLCHDLGHGPFSHSLEYFILPKLGIYDFFHEEYSFKIIEKIVMDIGGLDFDVNDISDILENGGKNQKNEVYHFISNKIFGVDLDRIDYLKRDSDLLGVDLKIDFGKLIKGIRLKQINEEEYKVTLDADCIGLMNEMLEKRFIMFKNFYCHPLNDSVDFLLSRIIFECNSFLRLDQRVKDLDSFVKLNDDIVKEFVDLQESDLVERFSFSAEKAKVVASLIEKYKSGGSYCYCGEFELKGKPYKSLKGKKLDDFLLKFKKILFKNRKDLFNDVEVGFLKIDNLKDVDYSSLLIRKGEEVMTVESYLEKEDIQLVQQKVVYRIRLYCVEENQKREVLERLSSFKGHSEFEIINLDTDIDQYDLKKEMKEYEEKKDK